MTIESKEKTTHEFIKTPMRPFIQVEVELKTGDQTQQIIDTLNAHNLDGAVIKILYHVPVGKKDCVDLQAIERTCSNAMHVVGIFPIRTHATREMRGALKVDMDFATLLATYFESKPELKERKKDLIEKALELYEESKQDQSEE